ncbi:MAG: hypothetical protein LAT83_10315 [Kiritimatiellae bacterium]|nr:hypothetical protein [Kiritimatiellia bacterium]
MDTTPFFVLLFFHLGFLILGFGSVLVTDLFGLLWMRDHIRFKQIVHVSGITGYFVWAGWFGMILTGVPLALLKGHVDALMILKFFFVLLIGLNGILLHLHQRRLQSFASEDEVSDLFMFRLGYSLFVSQVGWWGAILIGFLHRHIWTTITWPPQPWLAVGLILAGLLALRAVGELYFKTKI